MELFREDFEDLSKWDWWGAAPALQNSIVYGGTHALRCPPGTYAFHRFSLALNKLYAEAMCYYTAPLPGPSDQQVQFIHFQGASYAEILFIGIYRDSATSPMTLIVWSPFGNLTFKYDFDVPPNAWVKVGLEYTADVNGGWRAWINDVEVSNVTGVDTSSLPCEYVFATYSNITGVDAITDNYIVYDQRGGVTPTQVKLTYLCNIAAKLTVDGLLQVLPGESISLPLGSHEISVPPTISIIEPILSVTARMLAGIGTDYCAFYSDQPISVWTQTTFTQGGKTYHGHIDLLDDWKPLLGNVSAMGFVPPNLFEAPDKRVCSTYDPVKWEQLLQLFASKGCKVTANFHNNYPDSVGFYGSQAMTDFWLSFAQKWKGDQRMKGYILFNELTQSAGYKNYAPSITTLAQAIQYASWLTKEIHKIDAGALIIYPDLHMVFTWGQYETMLDLIDATGIFQEPNVVFDTLHPYYEEIPYWDYECTTPEQKAEYVGTHFIDPYIARVGADRVYSHGLFPFVGTNSRDPTKTHDPALQTRWITAMINIYQNRKIGWNSWAMLQKVPNDLAYQIQMNGVLASLWQPSPI